MLDNFLEIDGCLIYDDAFGRNLKALLEEDEEDE